jgi:SanA protein
MMKQDLLALGAEENRLFLDYAGFRTFDSVLRLRDIFGQQEAVVISQAFHNERALYIASREGMTLVGYNAQDVGRRAGRKVQMRERLARVKVFWDYLSNTQPRYLGEAVPIP